MAHSIFGATGIVLSIDVGYTGDLFWDCNWWSCYQNENERLFLGGMLPLEFITIRDIPLRINYSPYIKVLKIFDCMVKGWALGGIVPKSKDVVGLSALIDCILRDNSSAGEVHTGNSSIPSYIISFFTHFLLQKERVIINIDDWTFHKGEYDDDYQFYGYGYSKFVGIFLQRDNNNDNNNNSDTLNLTESIPKFNIFIKTMPNLKTIIIFNEKGMGNLSASISLSGGLFTELLNLIILISSMSYSLFQYIQIVQPTTSIKLFIDKYNDKFKKYGWIATKAKFKYVPFGLESDNSLIIKKM